MKALRISGAMVALVLCASRLAAQSDPRLATAVRLAQDGLTDSARAVAGRILQATSPADSLYPEVLYTMGLLAATESDRRVYLRRVVVDYGQSAWADDALLQLAQLDYAGGNIVGAVRQAEQLLRDYPASTLVAPAAFWGARAAGDRRDAAAACRMADIGLGAVGADVELKNLLEFQKQRCQGLGAMAADSVRRAAADPAAKAQADSVARAKVAAKVKSPKSAGIRPGFYVQVSAVKTAAAATAETSRVKQTGFQPVTTKERGYLKIRAGPFPTRAAAAAAAAKIKARLGGKPFVVRLP